MDVDKTKVGLILPLSTIPQARQRGLLTDAGAQRLVVVKNWRRVVRGTAGEVRPGDTAWFAHLSAVPIRDDSDHLSLTAQASEFLHTLKGASILGIEAVTGRKTSDLKAFRAMLRDAEIVLRRGGQRVPPKGYLGKPGPKSIKPKGEAFIDLLGMWKSSDFTTNKAAIKAMRLTIDESTAYRWFGPSGRDVGPKHIRRKAK